MRALLAAVALASLAGACSRSEETRSVTIGTRFAAAPPPAATAVAPAAGLATDASDLLGALAEAGTPSNTYTIATPRTPAPPPAPPPPNPDDAILVSAHDAVGRCFASLRAGPGFGPPSHHARIDVTVIPTGRVSRAEIGSTDVSDPAALDCMRRAASDTVFSDNDGGPLRTYSIDVRAVAR